MTEPHVDLASLGWDDSWPGLARHAGEPGRVVRVDRGACSVLTGPGLLRATCGGDVLDAMAEDPSLAPCTGDWCVVRRWPDGPITMEAIGERRTRLLRAAAARGSHGQLLAANLDIAGLVVGLHPEPNLGRIERLLSIAWEGGAEPMIVLTKADLVVDAAEIAEDVREAAPGVRVLVCSAATGAGLDELRRTIRPGRTIALVGASGHGKSTLANALLGAAVLGTRAIRDDGKGRHTSVRRELVALPGGGAVIDTPGLRGVGLQRGPESVDRAFPDMVELTRRCRFRDCRHGSEPGCAVRTALADGRLSQRRFESWDRLRREAVQAQVRSGARARAARARGWRVRSRQPAATDLDLQLPDAHAEGGGVQR